MNTVSQLLLHIAKVLPNGYWRIIRYAAERDKDLWDYSIPLRGYPNSVLRADLRESVYAPLFRTGHIPHQIGLDKLVRELTKPGCTVIDVGANVGYTSLVFSNLVGPNGKVVCIEPSPQAYALLSRTLNGIANTVCVNVAASETKGTLDFYVPKFLDRASSEYLEHAERISVQCQTIDDISARFGEPHLIKVDVEGGEPSVFRGMKKTMQQSNTPILIFEALTNSRLQECITTINDLSGDKYIYHRIDTNGNLLGFDSSFGSSDYVALPL